MRPETILIPCLLFAAGCAQPDGSVGASQTFQLVLDQPPEPISALDILFVIDDSASMEGQQQALIEGAGASLFGQLEAEVGGLPDLHVAFVSTDMGTGGLANTGCSGVGSDGRFRFGTGRPEDPGCPFIDGRFLVDQPDGVGGRTRNFEGTLADAFACAADYGIGGCGFEQPLEAMRRALDGSNPENDGFLRDDAMLLVVILSDEDDCSAADPEVFGTWDNDLTSPLGPLMSFRCFEFGVVCDDDSPTPREHGPRTACVPREDSAYMHPVAPYAEFLRGLKSDPSMVMVAGMFGDAGPVEVGPDPERPTTLALADVCAGDSDAAPAVRLNALAEGFPARWVFASICEPQMSQRLTQIAHTTGAVLAARGCLAAELPAAPVCRAFAAPVGGARRAVDVTIEPDATQCGHTPHGLIARASTALQDGEHLLVECAAPAP